MLHRMYRVFGYQFWDAHARAVALTLSDVRRYHSTRVGLHIIYGTYIYYTYYTFDEIIVWREFHR